jgi:adenine C2-methylase RlmN of 23S rRNA A2503 and tRNA A37
MNTSPPERKPPLTDEYVPFSKIEFKLVELLEKQEQLVQEFSSKSNINARLKASIKRNQAIARLKYRSQRLTEDGRKVTRDWADDMVDCDLDEEYETMAVSEAELESIRLAIQSVRSSIDVYRSIYASMRIHS